MANQVKWGLCLWIVAVTVPFIAYAEKPTGWIMAGTAPQDYTVGLDRGVKHDGQSSVRIAAKSDSPSGFGTLMQEFRADDWRGKRVRFRGHVKTEDIAQLVGLWMRIDGPDGKPQAFDNMSTRPIKGTSDWKAYDVVLDIPADAKLVALGLLIQGTGTAWLDECSFEEVSKDVPVTDMMSKRDSEPSGPQNLGLEPAGNK